MKKIVELIRGVLNQAEIEDADFETEQIIRHVTGLSHSEFVMADTIEFESAGKAFLLARKREKHIPLQYLIGEWDFYDCTFSVGSGVLIPRPETEFIVEKALEIIPQNSCATVVDLCAGSGCIGITVAKHRPDTQVILVEKEDDALHYIIENIRRANVKNCHVIKGDLFDGCDFSFDVLLTNPPYIATSEIPLLQKEVRFEPVTALDGGSDGLDFYRGISEKWLDKINNGGFCIAECGENQPAAVLEMFSDKLTDCEIYKDIFGVERFVFGRK